MNNKSKNRTTPSALPTAAFTKDSSSGSYHYRHRVLRNPEPERRLRGRGVTCAADKLRGGACVCARPKAVVFCHACGYFRPGRKRIHCPKHPAVHFLYDVETCEKCHASFYLHEYTL